MTDTISVDDILTRMVERIDAAAERAWGPMESLKDSGVVRPLSPTPTAKEAGLTAVLVIGWDEDKVLRAFSTTADVGANLELCEMFKYQLISGEFAE